MMIDGTTVVSWIVGVGMTVLVGLYMYTSMLDKCYEQPSVKHGRFWLCQGIAVFVALCIYLTRIGVIIWQ